jgi:magnesium and cobalt exporter, CNNM family
MALLITYVLIALGFSFLCSLLEATLLSVTASTVHTARQRGESWAEKMAVLKQDVDRPLSAILTLNTIAHTMGAAGAGAEYARIYHNKGEAVFAGVLTFAILIFTEIIPKTLGAKYSMFFAKPTAHFLPVLEKLLFPLVWLCGFITRMITFGGAHGKPRHREVLLAAADMGEEEGEIKVEESKVVRNVMRLSEMKTRDIMTPRSVMFMLPATTGLDEFVKQIAEKPYSRIPVFGENRDDITGVVIRAEALLGALQAKNWELEQFRREVIQVESHTAVDELMRTFLDEGHHFGLVTDRFGTVTGLVTLEDILETVVGVEIMDESDKVADLQEVARKLWRGRARKKGLDAKELDAVSLDTGASTEANGSILSKPKD